MNAIKINDNGFPEMILSCSDINYLHEVYGGLWVLFEYPIGWDWKWNGERFTAPIEVIDE